MPRKYDKYELEIIISLGALILFLISINFISGYSFHRAARGYKKQFEDSLNLSALVIKYRLESEYPRWERSPLVLNDLLQDLSVLTDINDIRIIDKNGRELSSLGDEMPDTANRKLINITLPVRSGDGSPIAYLKVSKADLMGTEFGNLSRWDMVFRIAGLVSALIVGAYFLWAVLYPYRRIKREALNYNLDIRHDGKARGIEYIVKTFKNVIRELEEKSSQLEDMYLDSERKANSIARYNEYILGSITSGVIICDSKGIVTRFNRSAESILSYFETDCRGKHYGEIFGSESKLSRMLDDALIYGKVRSRQEFEIRRPDGERLWLGCSSSMVNDDRGEGMGAVLLMIDLTEIRHLQEISSYSEKMTSLGEMAAGLAHEIRNSFAAIMGFANLIKKTAGSENEIIQLAEILKKESAAAENLLSRFLNFARPLHLQPEPVEIHKLVKSIASGPARVILGKIEIACDLEENIPAINADPALLKQALTNLLINAREAMSDVGEIIIEVRYEGKRIESRRDELVISVIDSGTGIDPEIKNKLFEPFFTNKDGGTGLGLAIVKRIVVLHRGRINVQSKPGKGTRITIYLPYFDLEELSDNYMTRENHPVALQS
jgi:PAS domain S-box-containing protein